MKLFKTKLDAATIVLIPACIGINCPFGWIPSGPVSEAAWADLLSGRSAARPTT